MNIFFYSQPLYKRIIFTILTLPITLPLALIAIPIFIYQFYKLSKHVIKSDFIETNKEL